MTIEELADKHDLTMEVHERRRPVGDPSRFYAHFKGADIKDSRFLVGVFGNGATPEDAVAEYARRISMQRLVLDAWLPTRREIDAPHPPKSVRPYPYTPRGRRERATGGRGRGD